MQWILERFGVSRVRACRLGGISRAGWYRKSTARDQTALRMRIREIAESRPRFGFQRIHVVLRREGWPVNKKRIHRLYRLEGLQVRMRVRRRKRLSLHRGPAHRPVAANERWSMDFVHDQLADGRAFRVLTVVDNWSRESVLLETGFRLTGETVAQALKRAGMTRSLPRSITVDHGTEFTSRALDQWALSLIAVMEPPVIGVNGASAGTRCGHFGWAISPVFGWTCPDACSGRPEQARHEPCAAGLSGPLPGFGRVSPHRGAVGGWGLRG